MNTETFERLLKQAVPDGKTIREIRIRTEKPVMILLESGENLLFSDGTCGKTESYGKKKMGSLEIREDRSVVLADQELIRGILETCSRHSLYAYEREISQGFLTICGGHRVGIAGKAVVEDGHVRTVRDLSSLNIRVAHEVKGCAKNVLPYLMDGETFLDTLLISPPGAGKTTLLNIIMGLVSADSGMAGYSFQSGAVMTDGGYRTSAVFQETSLVPHLNPVINVAMVLGNNSDKKRINQELGCLIDEEFLDKPCAQYSGGMKRRVEIVRAIMADSDIVVMDEPFAGLDDTTKNKVIGYIMDNIGDRILIISTHDLSDAEKLRANVFFVDT